MKWQSVGQTINRGTIIKNGIVTLAGLAGGGCVRHTQGEHIPPGVDKNEDALFSFVQLNDTHIETPDRAPFAYRKANEKLQYVIDAINRQEKFNLPDFVILAGDIIQGEARERLLPECKVARQMLARLRCPYYTVIGNHDVVQREGDPRFQGPYERVFGANRVNYYFIHKGILFVCVNNSGAKGQGDRVSGQRNKWLADVLRAHPVVPKIVACHIPMVCLREEDVLAKSFGFRTYEMLGSGTWDIIRKNRKTVIAVLCGHLHLTGVTKIDDIIHICPSGTASYPCHYAHYTVYRDRIDVVMHQVSKDLVTPGTNIHGKRRHKCDFTDKAHATAEEYVGGTEGERNRTILLTEAELAQRHSRDVPRTSITAVKALLPSAFAASFAKASEPGEATEHNSADRHGESIFFGVHPCLSVVSSSPSRPGLPPPHRAMCRRPPI